MITFMRDEEGNLYSVKDGVVIGKIITTGDSEIKVKEEKKDGEGNRGIINRSF